MKHFKESEMIKVKDEDGNPYLIWPDCKDHAPNSRNPFKFLDCKNTFTTKEGFDGQCCCYSKEHGMR